MAGHHPAVWVVFGLVVLGVLAVDLFVIARSHEEWSTRALGRWTAIVVAIALLFGGYVFAAGGATKALEYYAGYVIELSLSVDNLFVFLLIFRYFAVPKHSQTRVLMIGVVSAIGLRAVMVFVGAAALEHFEWLIYVLGGMLLFTAVRMFRSEIHLEPERNPWCGRLDGSCPSPSGTWGTSSWSTVGSGAGTRPRWCWWCWCSSGPT